MPQLDTLQRHPSTHAMIQEYQFTIPDDVLSKYEVETVSEAPEMIIKKKIYSENFPEKEEAFYIVDLGVVLNKYRQWMMALPRVKPFYAIKCNNNTAIVKTLAHLGVNFDCASKSEIQQVLGCGVSPSRIIYANPTKMKSHITYAHSVGVDLMTFDNSHELQKIADSYPSSRLLLRIITDDSQSVCKFSTKFGAPITQCDHLLSLAKSLGLNVVGISFHVGSGCMSSNSFVYAIRNAALIFQRGNELGFNMSILDLGGGWPGTDDDGITFEEIAESISPVIDELFPEEVDIIAEPGRYFVAQSHTLAVNVFAKRTVELDVDTAEEGETKKFLYYINDGVYQSFNCIFFDHAQPVPNVLEPRNRNQQFKCTLFGPTCDSMDCIIKDMELPELEVGEWLYFKNMGAYTVAAASPFNGFKAFPNTYYVQSQLTE